MKTLQAWIHTHGGGFFDETVETLRAFRKLGLLNKQARPLLSKLGEPELRLEPPYTGVQSPSGPEIPKKSQNGVPGPPGPECQKSVEKVPNDPPKSQKDYKRTYTV